MATTHVIRGGVVVNTIVATVSEAREAYPHDVCIAADIGAIGWAWDGTQLIAPAPQPQAQRSAPQTVTRAQGKAALIQAGYWPGVLAFVASIEDETQRALAEVALHDTLEWQRSSPFLNAAAAGMGITAEQLDALFVAAGEIQL